jgi:hypothetical protein
VHLLLADRRPRATALFLQVTPLRRRQTLLERPLLFAQGLVLFRRCRLALQVLQLAIELFAQVREALEVLERTAHPRLRFPAPLLVLRDTRGLLDKHAQVLGPGLDQARNHALFDDRVAARPEARAEKDIRDIAASTARAVEEVLGLAVAGHLPPRGDFAVARVLTANTAIAVVKHEFNRRLANGLPVAGTVEDHVGHALAAQVLGGALPHDPAHGVDDVGFSTAVGADHGAHVARQVDRCRVDKGLETGQLDGFQAHLL